MIQRKKARRKRAIGISFSYFFLSSASHERERLERYKKNIDAFVIQENERLKKCAEKAEKKDFSSNEHESSYFDFLGDEKAQINDYKDLAYELLIIGLFRSVENAYVRIITERFPELPELKKELRRNLIGKKVEKELRRIGIDIYKVACFKTMNELRLINNDIKHNGGRVEKELAEKFGFRGWKKGKRFNFKKLENAYSRIVPKTEKFLRAFVKKIEKNTAGKKDKIIP